MEIRPASGFRPEKTAPSASKAGSRPKKTQNQPHPRMDTYERTDDSPFGRQMKSGSREGIVWDGTVPSPGTLKVIDPNDLIRDGIDWERVEHYYTQNTEITLDNADSVERTVDSMAAMYVAVQKKLESTYADQEDKLSENMQRLDSLFAQGKTRLISSFRSSVGRFYESTGNKGIASSMGNSLSDALDKRIQELESMGDEKGLFSKEKNYSYDFLYVALSVDSLVKQESQADSVENEKNNSLKNDKSFSLKELQAAGFVAKAASKMDSRELLFLNGKELGIQLAVRYMKMATFLDRSGMDKEMSSLLLGSFGAYLDQYSGGALTDASQSSSLYQYAVKQYDSTKDIAEIVAQSAIRYFGDSFFSEFLIYGNGAGMARSTRYNLDISQFMTALEQGDSASVLQSIAGNRIYPSSFYG